MAAYPLKRQTKQWGSDPPLFMIPSDELLDLCETAADAATDAIRDIKGTPEAFKTVYTGADGTDTKLIDDVSEKAILQVLKNCGRSMRVLSEELGEMFIGDDPEFTVILDPLDGTYNAATDIPFYSISIAFAETDIGKVRFGYVRNLANKDTFYAEYGKGACFNGKRIYPSTNNNLKDFCVSVYGYHLHVERTINLCKSVRRIRIFGSVALELCHVAAGKLDAFVDVRGSLRLIDVAAGKLIIEEAGGFVSNEKGTELKLRDSVINRFYMVASNGHAHDQILSVLERF